MRAGGGERLLRRIRRRKEQRGGACLFSFVSGVYRVSPVLSLLSVLGYAVLPSVIVQVVALVLGYLRACIAVPKRQVATEHPKYCVQEVQFLSSSSL